jgi:hypothetical protein
VRLRLPTHPPARASARARARSQPTTARRSRTAAPQPHRSRAATSSAVGDIDVSDAATRTEITAAVARAGKSGASSLLATLRKTRHELMHQDLVRRSPTLRPRSPRAARPAPPRSRARSNLLLEHTTGLGKAATNQTEFLQQAKPRVPR